MDVHYLRRRQQPAAAVAPVRLDESSTATPPGPGLAQLQILIQHMPQLAWLQGSATDTAYWSQSWQDWAGADQLLAAGPDWTCQLHPDDSLVIHTLWQQTRSSEQSEPAFACDVRLRHHSGQYRWCRVQARSMRVMDEEQPVWLLSAVDIHDRVDHEHSLQESMLAQTRMLDVSVDCIKIIRPDGSLSHMNRSGCLALGVAPDSGFGMQWLNLLPPEIRQRGKRALRLAVGGKNARFDGMSVIPGQKPQYWDNILTPIKTADGSTSGILCVSRDITLQRSAELQMRDASELDDLTGLPNRRAFKGKVKQIIKHSRENHLQFGVMLLDLDHFKHINDTLGHVAGDHLLRVLSRRLASLLPASSVLARLGGDEFAIAIRHIADETDLLNLAEIVRQQINAPSPMPANRSMAA